MKGVSYQHARRTWLWWNGDKDAAWALGLLHSSSYWDVQRLITVVNHSNGRNVLNGVRKELMDEQALAVGLPLFAIECGEEAPSGEYESAVQRALSTLDRDGAEFLAFGDLSWASKRTLRSVLLAGTGLKPTFPLWGRDARTHVEELLSAGLSAWVCAVTTPEVPASLAGCRFDRRFLEFLPAHVDPCGERDEFHTFVEWAPGWNRHVLVEPRRLIKRYNLTLADLHSASLRTGVPVPWHRSYPAAQEEYDPFEYFARLGRIRSFVDQHLRDELRLDVVAPVAAMTPSSFGSYFRRHVGVSFRCWLVRYRVERACRLLRTCDMSVVLVGRAVGFRCNRTFRRVFGEQSGCSPSQYRKMYLAGRRRTTAPASPKAVVKRLF